MTSGHRTVFSVVLICVIVIAGGAALRLSRARERAAIALAGVPPIPDLSRWPADFAREVQEATAVARNTRDPIAPLTQLVGLYLANAYNTQALQALSALHQLEPNDARWSYLIANAQQRQAESNAAEESLWHAVRRNPDYLPAWFQLAELLVKRGAIDEARDCYAKAIQSAPEDNRAAYYQIAFESWYGNLDDSRRRLAELVRLHPDISDLHTLLAELHARFGDPSGAEQERRLAASAARELTHDDPWLDDLTRFCFDGERLAVLAEEAVREQRFEVAVTLLERAITISPSYLAPHSALHTLYRRLGRIQEAHRVLERAVAAFPDDPGLRIQWAQLLDEQHQSEEALALLEAALQRWPDHAELYTAIGVMRGSAGDLEASVSAFQQAIRLNPVLVNAHLNLGISLFELGRFEAARAAAESALSMRPDFAEALGLLASLALESGDLDAAEAALYRQMAVRPDAETRQQFAMLRLMKGEAAELAGDYASAADFYRAGLEVNPNDMSLLRASRRLARRTATSTNAGGADPR